MSFSRDSRRSKRKPSSTRRRRMVCETLERRVVLSATIGNNIAVGNELRNYRLAVATTEEYTAAIGGEAAALASVNQLVDDLNAVFEKELAIHLDLVTGVNTIFEPGDNDMLTNGNLGTIVNEGTSVLDAAIGSTAYDIGHVLGTFAGSGTSGLAYLGVVRNATLKGGGGTVVNNIGDVGSEGWTLVVAHELGHQFAAPHTFNSELAGTNCTASTRDGSSAYEPASGSTLMSYAGICGADNLQNSEDPVFHSASFEEINTYIAGVGNGPLTTTPIVNDIPTVSGGSDFTIPAQTPFSLSAVGTDADPLTYSWEQLDLGAAQNLPLSDLGSGPIFRAFAPTTDPTRVFPRLADQLAGVNTAAIGEVLPATNRNLNFRVTVRDDKGGVNSDDVLLTSVNTGTPFALTAPNGAEAWSGGSSQTVTWNVGGTDANGINVANVAIDLSLDGGLTYPFALESSTPNDGSHTLNAPNIDAAEARLRVRPVGNIFFDISDADFAITSNSGAAGVTVAESGGSTFIYEDGVVGSPGSDSYTLALNTLPTAAVTITVDGGSQAEVSLDNVNFASSAVFDRTDTVSQTIYVRGFDDTLGEGIHSGKITHMVTASTDASYPLGMLINPVFVGIADDEQQPVVGVDFDVSTGSSPANWTLAFDAFDETLSSLIREDGVVTGIGLTVDVPGGTLGGVNPSAANAVPNHSPSLVGIDGNKLNSDSISLTWTGLTPGTDYHVYLLLTEFFASSIQQQIAITGGAGNPLPFMQDTAPIDTGLLVNAGLADAAKPIEADAVVAQADANGEIKIVVTDISAGGVNDAMLAGAAIQEIGPNAIGFGVIQTGDSTTVTEAGTTDTFDVVLFSQPSGNVVIDIAGDDPGEATVGPVTLTFDATNWNVPQTVTITGVDDSDNDGGQTSTITLSIDQAATADDNYDNVGDRLLNVVTADNEATPLIGVDFESSGGSNVAPTNWTLATTNTGAVTTFADLMNEDGDPTAIDLTVTLSSIGTADVPPPANLPDHPNPLGEIGGAWYSSNTVTLTWSDLTPGTDYDLWLFGAEDFGNSTGQTVTIDGGGVDPAPFDMDLDAAGFNTLMVNDAVADPARGLLDDAVRATADASGEITITLAKLSGKDFALFSGAAIQEIVPTPPLELTLTIDAASISENGGSSSATVTRIGSTSGDLVVTLSSNDTSEATVPHSVTIPDGSASVAFTITGVNDATVDGTQTVTITAYETNATTELVADASFSVDGSVTTMLRNNLSPKYLDLVVQPDGKVVTIGRHESLDDTWRVIRLNEDGSFDNSFGTGGSVITTFNGLSSVWPDDVILHSDGRISVTGRHQVGSLIARYTASGAHDLSFSGDGRVELESATVYKGTANPDGSLNLIGNKSGAFLMRIRDNGSLDWSLGPGGLVSPTFDPTATESVFDVVQQNDGKLIVAGEVSLSGSVHVFVTRFHLDGSLDNSFGTNGYSVLDTGVSSIDVNAVALQPDGGIVAVGKASNDWLVTRFTSAGAVDTTFSGDGMTGIDFNGLTDVVRDVVVQDDGKIIVVGEGFVSGNGADRAIARLNSDGTLDTTFSVDGKHTFAPFLPTEFEGIWAAELLSQGRIVTLSGWAADYRIERWILPGIGVTGTDTVDVLDDDVSNPDLDLGDAPAAAQLIGFANSYPVLVVNDGARHQLATAGPTLGVNVDAEFDGNHSVRRGR